MQSRLRRPYACWQDRLSVLFQAPGEGTQAVAVGQHRPDVDGLAGVAHHMDVHSLPAEIQANVQHCSEASSGVADPGGAAGPWMAVGQADGVEVGEAEVQDCPRGHFGRCLQAPKP
jgi:hypothetical protein